MYQQSHELQYDKEFDNKDMFEIKIEINIAHERN